MKTPIDVDEPVYSAGTPNGPCDAQLILDVIHATRQWMAEREKSAAVKPMKELIWHVWEQPRLRHYANGRDRKLIKGKYPSWVPWSPRARAAHRSGATAFVFEHVTPSTVLVNDLLDRPPANPAALIRVLNRRLRYTVLAREDNQALTAAGVRNRLPTGSRDPWDRYRAAGLEPSSFEPLT